MLEHDATTPYLSACAIYLDEGPYIREWIEFHRLVGVERFFLYDHESTDNHLEVLAPYLEDGTVVLHDWPVSPGQLEAYRDCLARHAGDARWIAFLDLDEFLFSPTGERLPELLSEYEQWPGVTVHRASFGTSGHKAKPAGLVLESYTHRTRDAYRNSIFKSIVNPREAIDVRNPEEFVYRSGFAVDENKQQAPDGAVAGRCSWSRLRINHYVTKSEAEWREKITRPRADTDEPRAGRLKHLEQLVELMNQEPDRAIQIYLPALREALKGIAQHGGTGAERRPLG